MREAKGNLEELEQLQEQNEIMANIPTEMEVAGRVIKLKSRTIPEIVKIDKVILEFQRIMFDITTEDAEELTEEQAEQRILERQKQVAQAMAKTLFYIINEDYENPEHTEEWIINNIPLDKLNEILDIYEQRNNMGEFLKKIAMARKF